MARWLPVVALCETTLNCLSATTFTFTFREFVRHFYFTLEILKGI